MKRKKKNLSKRPELNADVIVARRIQVLLTLTGRDKDRLSRICNYTGNSMATTARMVLHQWLNEQGRVKSQEQSRRCDSHAPYSE